MEEKDSKREELKGRILRVSIEAFAKDGIKPVTMDKIASSLCISKRTLYEVYEDKEALLEDCFRLLKSEKQARLKSMYENCDNVLTFLYELYKIHMNEIQTVNPRLYDDIVKYPKLQEMIKCESAERNKTADQFFARGVEQGLFLPEINYGLLRLVNEVVREGFMKDNSKLKEFSMEESFHTMFFISVRGICTEKGRMLFDSLFLNK